MGRDPEDDMRERLLEELSEVRARLHRLDGVLVTSKAAEVMESTGKSPAGLAQRYRKDMSEYKTTELIGYRLADGPASETCVHVAFDSELGEGVIYEEW